MINRQSTGGIGWPKCVVRFNGYQEKDGMPAMCPLCDKAIKLKDFLEIGQQIRCPSCGGQLDVVWLYPLEIVSSEGSAAPKAEAPQGDRRQKWGRGLKKGD